MVPNLGEPPPPGEFVHLGRGDAQLSKTIQKHLFGFKKIHLIYKYKASDSLNFYEVPVSLTELLLRSTTYILLKLYGMFI